MVGIVFKIIKTSDFKYKDFIEIATLEQLLDFVNRNGDIIISNNNNQNKQYKLEIYDKRRETHVS